MRDYMKNCISAEGCSGKITVCNGEIYIEEGILSRTIPLKHILFIKFKNADAFINGYIQILFNKEFYKDDSYEQFNNDFDFHDEYEMVIEAEEDEDRGLKIMFNLKQEKDFITLKNQIDRFLINKSLTSLKNLEKSSLKLQSYIRKLKESSIQYNYLFEIEKLSELKDKGILTEDEFIQKKKQLLGILGIKNEE